MKQVFVETQCEWLMHHDKASTLLISFFLIPRLMMFSAQMIAVFIPVFYPNRMIAVMITSFQTEALIFVFPLSYIYFSLPRILR